MDSLAIPAINPGEGIGEPYDQIMCPYNKAHIIQRYKLAPHLVKCAAQHKSSGAKTCPFDNKHVIAEEKFDHHIKTCPQRRMLDHVKYNIDPAVERAPVVLPAPQIEATEDWENDNFNSYNPLEHAEQQSSIIRKIKGVAPADRRAFRMEQRRNFRQNN